MKKTFKKLMAALLAVALLCAMAVPAFAAEGASGTSAGNGSITINNAVDNMHYNFYRILDIATHTGTEPYTGVVYKTNPTWKDFIEQSTWENYLTVNTDGTVTVKAAAENNSDFAASFAAAASTYATTNHISADYADQLPVNHQVHLTGVTLGYYLVSSTGWDSNQTIICSLDTTKPNAEINEKNGKPSISKKVEEDYTNGLGSKNDADIGQYVKFQTTVTVTDGNPYNYIVTDTMSAGLTFVQNDIEHALSVTVNGEVFNQYTLRSTSDRGFTIHFNDADSKHSVLQPNDSVVVTYYAVINQNAVVGNSGNNNTATLTYGKNSENGGSSTTTTYVWSFDVHKYTGENTALAGAVFQILNSDASKTAHFVLDNTTGAYKFVSWDASEGSVTDVTTPDNGNIKFEGLDSGSYKLREVKAPDGYNKLAQDIDFSIDGVNAATPGTVHYSTDKTGRIDVLNNAGATLPSTGGMGTTLFYVIGGGLMVAAVVLRVTKKRMENK